MHFINIKGLNKTLRWLVFVFFAKHFCSLFFMRWKTAKQQCYLWLQNAEEQEKIFFSNWLCCDTMNILTVLECCGDLPACLLFAVCCPFCLPFSFFLVVVSLQRNMMQYLFSFWFRVLLFMGFKMVVKNLIVFLN